MGEEEQKPQKPKPQEGQKKPVQRPAADPDLDDYHKNTYDPSKIKNK